MRILLVLLITAASFGQEIVYNEFIALDYYRVKIKIRISGADTSLYIPTEETRSKKISETNAACYIRSRWVSSSGFEFHFPVSVRISEQIESRTAPPLYTVRKSEIPAEADLLFRLPAVSHEKKIFILGEWHNIPVHPKLTSEQKNTELLLAAGDRDFAEGNYRQALMHYLQIIQLDKGRYDEIALKAAYAQTELGSEYLAEGKTDDAYIMLSSAHEAMQKVSKERISRTDSLLGLCLKAMGEKSFARNLPGESLYYLQESMKYNPGQELQERISYIQSTKRSRWVLGLTGVLPGVGQFYKGEYAKGTIMAGLFTAGIAIMSINFAEADKNEREADEYAALLPDAIGNDRIAFRRLEFAKRDEARRKNQIAYTALAVSCVTLFWSIYDGIYTEDELYRVKKPERGFDLTAGFLNDNPALQMVFRF